MNVWMFVLQKCRYTYSTLDGISVHEYLSTITVQSSYTYRTHRTGIPAVCAEYRVERCSGNCCKLNPNGVVATESSDGLNGTQHSNTAIQSELRYCDYCYEAPGSRVVVVVVLDPLPELLIVCLPHSLACWLGFRVTNECDTNKNYCRYSISSTNHPRPLPLSARWCNNNVKEAVERNYFHLLFFCSARNN